MSYLTGVRLEELAGSESYIHGARKEVITFYYGLPSQYSKHAAVSWGASVGEWSVVSGSSQWVWAIWRIDWDQAFGTGLCAIEVTCVSGSAATIKIMKATDYDATATPNLSANTSGTSITAGETKTLNGANVTLGSSATAYLALVTGFAPHTASLRMNKIYWQGVKIWDTLTVGTFVQSMRKEV